MTAIDTKATSFDLSISLTDGFIQQLSKLLMSDHLADIVFIVEKERIPAHRIILAARSEYFRAMLFGGLAEAQQKEIDLPEVSLAAFKPLLKYLYTGDLKISLESENHNKLLELLHLTNLYGLEDLKLALSDELEKRICTKNVCVILNAASLYDFMDIKQKCLSYFDSNTSLLTEGDSINSLSMDSFIEVIKRDSFCVSEGLIFKAVLRWKQHNPEISDIQPLISCVRFPLIEVKTLVTEVRDLGIFEDGKLFEIIKQRESSNCLPHRVHTIELKCIEGEKTEQDMFLGYNVVFQLIRRRNINTIIISGLYRQAKLLCAEFGQTKIATFSQSPFVYTFKTTVVTKICLATMTDEKICVSKPQVMFDPSVCY